jgi:endonuclease/exonuclease/phosphatase family metal-dependent hydrolase
LLSKAESITKHARYAVTATLHIGRRYFDVSSVHLSPYSEKAFKEGVEKTFELKGIIAGDFNAEYKNFEDKTYFMRKTDNNIRETYITKGTIIDFVFAPFYYRMDTTQVKGDRYASDHLLVYAPIWIN